MFDSELNRKIKDALNALSLADQRRIGARFIENVLDLADDARLGRVVESLMQPEITPEDLLKAHQTARSVYVETHPHSDLEELSFGLQAAHFVAEACMVCTEPAYEQAKAIHLAQKVAMYCRMARTCSSMAHDTEEPDFSVAEEAAKGVFQDQVGIIEGFGG